MSYTVISGPALISGDVLAITGAAGYVDVEADQAGNATYAPATPVVESFMVNPAPSAVIVTTLADDPSGSIFGYITLRDAISDANTWPTRSVEITFAVTGTIDLTSALPDLANNITIQGPGATKLTVQRDSTAAQFSVFTIEGASINLSGMTITGGSAGSTLFSYDGGGIINDGTLTVTNSTLTDNTASASGGGILNQGTLTVTNSTLTDNTASNSGGGGIENYGTLTVTNSTFTNNTAASGRNDVGGGISNSGALTVTNSTFTNNTAELWGGGISNNTGNTLTVTNSTFTNNTANGGGGGIMNYAGGSSTVTNSTFTNNTAPDSGGVCTTSPLTIINSTFTKNTGGIYNEYSTLTLTNCTISDNTVNGGIYNYDGTGATLTLNNTIVAGNVGDDVFGQVQPTSAYNLIGDGTGITNLTQLDQSNFIGTTAHPLNPLLGPLDYYGGPTQTMALLPGSPAINAGSNALILAGVTTDQRGVGFLRIVNGTVDIGAFESSGFTVTVTSGSGQSTGSLTAFSAPLVVTVTANNPNEPVAGGLVTFTPPPSGASATLSGSPATISATGRASVTAAANSIIGSYTVSATASGITTPASFSLTNMRVVPTFSALTSPTIVYGTSTTTLTGHLGSGTAYPTGSNVSITLNSVTQTASVDGSGDFTTTFSTGSLGVAGGPYTVTYAFAGNSSFTAATDTSTTLTVTAAPLTASIIGDPTKTYDGTTSATLTQANFSLSGLVETQSFTVTQTVGTYNSKDVTAATTVMASLSPSDFTPGSGTVASNYILPTTASGAGTITPKALTYSGLSVPASKVYDGTTTAEVSGTAALQTAEAAGTGSTADCKPYSVDSVSLTGTPTGTYNSKDVATATTVTFGGLALTGTGNGDYTLPTTASGAGNIKAAPLTVTATNESMVYGGTVPA